MTYEHDAIERVETTMGTFYWPSSSTPEKTQQILNHFNLPHTPLNHDWWHHHLQDHPDQLLVAQVLRGIREGFPIGYTGPRDTFHPTTRAHHSPNLSQLKTEIVSEVDQGRMLGPFQSLPQPLFYFYRANPSFLVPKTNAKWRRIDNMSYPPGLSVNDAISKEDFPVDYVTTTDMMQHMASVPPGTLMSSRDICDGYRHVLCHPSDWPLMTLMIGSKFYVNIRLGMSTTSSCGHFDTLSNLTIWIFLHKKWPIPYLNSP